MSDHMSTSSPTNSNFMLACIICSSLTGIIIGLCPIQLCPQNSIIFSVLLPSIHTNKSIGNLIFSITTSYFLYRILPIRYEYAAKTQDTFRKSLLAIRFLLVLLKFETFIISQGSYGVSSIS